ncbi:MAG TPA: hypothetical protein VLI39_20060 [Sedimentisphaerales bacterium]|nr:hypothetical protein [Sedimentisphaerales bacterium]
MTVSEKRYWIILLTYCGLLCLSLLLFVADPDWRIGTVAWNAFFQVFGPTVGTIVLLLVTLVQLARRKISVLNGVVGMILLMAVSFVCLFLIVPIMMMGV